MKFLLLTCCVIMSFSCTHEKKILPPIISPSDTTELPERSVAKTFKGLFVAGKNMLSFRNCDNPDEDYFVIDSTHQMADLYKTMFMNSPAFPYEYVYVELNGIVSVAPPAIIARGFDSLITVNEILTFEQKNYRNTCIPYDFWALGDAPNWSMQVSQKEDIIALKDYSNNTVYLFEYFSPKVVNDEVFTYSSNNYANQTSITAVFKKQPCTSRASGTQYQYAVTVLINGKKYSGCAIRGLQGSQ